MANLINNDKYISSVMHTTYYFNTVVSLRLPNYYVIPKILL